MIFNTLKIKNSLIIAWSFILTLQSAFAQCDFDPIIVNPRIVDGSLIMCSPDEQTLETQTYDSYQWYKKEWSSQNPNTNPWVLIDGATNQTFIVNQDDILNYIKVEATLDGCTEESPEILIDGFAYGLPYAEVEYESGTFEHQSDGTTKVCNGASVTITQGFDQVYGYHRWFKCTPTNPYDDNDPCYINGVNGDQYIVTESGSYTFRACTEYCPDMCQWLGTFMTYEFGDWSFCTSGIDDINNSNDLIPYPNPTINYLYVIKDLNTNIKFELCIYNANGKLIFNDTDFKNSTPIDVTFFTPGIYILKLNDGVHTWSSKFIKS